MPYITLDTYPSMDREDYDEVVRLFTIPYAYLSEVYRESDFGSFDLDYFLCNEYTWDDTLRIYEEAYMDKVIVHEEEVKR